MNWTCILTRHSIYSMYSFIPRSNINSKTMVKIIIVFYSFDFFLKLLVIGPEIENWLRSNRCPHKRYQHGVLASTYAFYARVLRIFSILLSLLDTRTYTYSTQYILYLGSVQWQEGRKKLLCRYDEQIISIDRQKVCSHSHESFLLHSSDIISTFP